MRTLFDYTPNKVEIARSLAGYRRLPESKQIPILISWLNFQRYAVENHRADVKVCVDLASHLGVALETDYCPRCGEPVLCWDREANQFEEAVRVICYSLRELEHSLAHTFNCVHDPEFVRGCLIQDPLKSMPHELLTCQACGYEVDTSGQLHEDDGLYICSACLKERQATAIRQHKNKRYKITGHDALGLAESDRLTLYSEAMPFDDGGPISPRMARQKIKYDPNLVYVIVEADGSFIEGSGKPLDDYHSSGYRVEDFFNHYNGEYLGADEDGIRPRFTDAKKGQRGE